MQKGRYAYITFDLCDCRYQTFQHEGAVVLIEIPPDFVLKMGLVPKRK